MNKNPALSIVIPIYNVEKFLKENIDSIIMQQCYTECEIIIVDDCSPDDSYLIAKGYEKKYQNIQIIRHEKNKGLGAARNTGLEHAKGKYVWFIDSDDVIVSNCIQKILYELNINDEDILMFNAEVLNCNGTRTPYYATYPNTTEVIKGYEFLSLHDVPHWQKPVTAWSRIQKISFLKKYNFKYPEGIFFEDEELNLRELFKAENVRFINEVFYLYRNNEESIMKTHFTVKKFMDKIKVFISCLNILHEYQNQFPETVNLIYKTHLSVLHQMTNVYKTMSKDERAEIRKQIKNLDISPIKYFSKSYKRFLLYFHPNIYDTLSKWLQKCK